MARAAGVSRQTVSRIELGRLDGVPLGSLRRVFAAVDVRVIVAARGIGAELPRLADQHHCRDARGCRAAVRPARRDGILCPRSRSRCSASEARSTSSRGTRRSRSLLVIELKTELVDLQDTVSTLDRKVRLAMQIAHDRGWDPATVSTWLVIAEGGRNRRAVERHAAFLRSRFPADGHAVMRWLRQPVGRLEGLSFLSSDRSTSAGQRLAPIRRVRRPQNRRWQPPHGSRSPTGWALAGRPSPAARLALTRWAYGTRGGPREVVTPTWWARGGWMLSNARRRAYAGEAAA